MWPVFDANLGGKELYTLVYPSITVMDMTIGPALYFASRAVGVDANGTRAISSARIFLLGNGPLRRMGLAS